VDYREVLNQEQFELFSRLRDKRKELALRDGVQVYTIMTNEQLAEVVKQKISDVADLGQIDGIGAARIEKYGADLLSGIEPIRNQLIYKRLSGKLFGLRRRFLNDCCNGSGL
jgi:superfamily II DNA helicase RecQ